MYIKCNKLFSLSLSLFLSLLSFSLSLSLLNCSSERLNDTTRFSETTGGLPTNSDSSSTHRKVKSDGGTEHEMYAFNILLLIIIILQSI